MKKFLLPGAFLLAFLFAEIYPAHATHIMGVDLSYECLAPGQYRLRLQLFRDCHGVDPGSSQIVSFSSAQCNTTSSATLQQVGPPEDITPVCPQQSNTVCSGGGQYGVEKYTYEGVMTLPAGCGNDWQLGWTQCCRNGAITDLTDPLGENIYIQICLDNTVSPCNNSPVFLNNPIPFYCANQPVNYNHGVIDIDGDSLVFLNACCLNGPGSTVSYLGGFNCGAPFATTGGGPLTVDLVNGDINFIPNQTQIGVMAILVNEYRNGVLIGCVVRDMQFTIIPCTNQLPTASGVGGSNNYTITIPACADTCFTITSADADASDVVTMTSNNAIPGATFTSSGGNRPTGTFCWGTTSSDVGTHYFTVNVEDDHCPITGNNTYSYTINVIPSNDPPVNAGPDVLLCPGASATLTASVTGGTPIGYAWSNGTTTWNTQSINVNPATTTIYTVTAFYASGCEKTDAVVVTRVPNPNISIFPTNITLCSGGSVNLLVSTTAVNPTYHWNPTAGLSCTNCPNPVATPAANTNYCVSITDAYNCPSNTVCSQINMAAPPPPQSCAVLYATVNGTGNGTQANPASLQGAINLAQCNNSIIKLGIGTYTLSSAITNITSYTTLEGGFDPITWSKTSSAGATRIYRDNTNPEGVPTAPRIVAIYMNSQAYFRFQDITFETQDCPATTAGNVAMSNYIFHMTSCSNYDFVRCRMITGDGGNGLPGISGVAGLNGSPGTNGSAGAIDNDSYNATGGNGGTGAGTGSGTGGTGGANGGNGNAGSSSTSPRAGGGGGGGGSGGQANTGGSGGNSGGVNGGGGTSGASGGTVGGDGVFTGDGNPGNNGSGSNGTPGSAGSAGSAGSFIGGFFVPGSIGGNGGDGGGGTGGSGGGGGGGQSCTFCTDGTGDAGGGGGGGGEGGLGGTGGSGGAASISVYAYNNGIGGNFTNCEFFIGTAGLGGTGGTGGAGGAGGSGGNGANTGSEIGRGGNGGAGGMGGAGGIGGNGAAGSAGLVYVDGGTSPGTDLTFNLSGQPVINVNNVACTYRDVTFSSATSGTWDFGAVSAPQTGNGASVITQYQTFGRKDITYNGNVYAGFFNVPIDANSFIPNITSTAPVYGVDTFILCRGSTANFTAVIPSADIFDWDFGGAVTPNTYNGSGAAFQTLSNLQFNTVGIFKVKVRINTTCCGYSPYDSVWVIVDMAPTLSFNGPFAICPGNSVTLTASGSTFYSWTPPTGLDTVFGATVVATPLVTTTYLVSGYSPYTFCRKDSQITVSVINPPTVTFTTIAATCGNNGSATVIPNPAGSYNYLWSDAATQTTATAVNLTANSYSVTVIDQNSTCSVTDGVAVPSGNGPQAYIDSSVNVSCFGACDGVARVRGLLGSGSFTYSWSNGGSGATTSALCPNVYTATVTDVSTNCTASASVTISQPNQLLVNFIDTTNVTCAALANGSAHGNASGGVGPYQYLWSDPNNQDSAHAVNLFAGNYTLTVIDQNGCTAMLSVPILAPPPLVVDTVTVTDVSCAGAADGQIVLSASGGVYPYTYTWQQLPAEFDSLAQSIAGGAYTVIVQDVYTCADTMIIPVFEPQPLMANVSSTDSVSCFGGSDGSVDLNATGGTTPYQYSLDGTNYQPSPTFTGLSANNYTATVRDAHLCISTVNFTINQPTQLSATLAGTTDVLCNAGNDGTATITITGGTPAYSATLGMQTVSTSPYTFNNLAVGNYNITATDANACTATVSAVINEPTALVLSLVNTTPTTCYGGSDGGINVSAIGGTLNYTYTINGSSPQATGVFTGVSGAANIVAVIDANLCIDTLHINVPQPIQTTFLDTSVIDANCFGGNDGSIDLTVSGTAGPWTITWNTGATTEDISSLVAGVYDVTVTDNIGCDAVGIDSIVITQPADLTLTQVTQNVSCFGGSDGSISVTATGGVPAYTYAWSGGQSSAQVSNLSVGTNNVTVTDAHSCSETLSNLIVTEPTLLTVTTNVTNVSCPGFSDGTMTANAGGGTPAYNYAWSNGAPDNMLNTNLAVGSYSVTVTDANSCTATAANAIIELPGISILADVHNVLCYPLQNGYVNVSAATVNPPASFVWSNGSITEDIYSLPVGDYSVTITDANNCVVDTSFTVSNDTSFSITAFPYDATIDLGQSVDITTTTFGGTLASIIWQPANGLSCSDCENPNASPLESIYYIATAISDSGCVASDRVNITVVPKYVIFIPNVFTPNGDGNNDFFEVFGNKEAWKQFEVQIYNRWGEKVYESGDMNFKWDGVYKGVIQGPAVFVYKVNITFIDNFTPTLYKGSVTIIR